MTPTMTGLDIPGPALDPHALLRTAAADTLTRTAGPCRQPIRLGRTRTTIHRTTGRAERHIDVFTARCGTRRHISCPACSTLYKYDTYNLIAAGLRGGKSTPAQVADHPRLFVTLTAPSFGPVHLGPTKRGDLRPCHPRREGQGPDCRTWHRTDDPLIGTPLNPDTYDYTGHILFNATAGQLWSRFTTDLRRHLADTGGLRRDQLTDHLTVSYAKVAEYQARGIIHYHAVIRLDGPHGPSTTPPAWATESVLEDAIRHAAATAVITTPAAPGLPGRTLRFGTQTDIKAMTDSTGSDRELSDSAVARYIAKYATKSTEASGIELRPIACRTCHATGTTTRTLPNGTNNAVFCPDCHGTGTRGPRDAIPRCDLTGHTGRLLATCWTLGARPELSTLRLRQWAHTLGFRGHISTRSRAYSTTLTALRQERTDYQTALAQAAFGPEPEQDPTTLIINTWHYLGRHTPEPTTDIPPPTTTDTGDGR